MPAPLYGADDPRNCSGSSKAEVLENIKNNFEAFLALWICPYISRHLLSLNPLLACCRRYSRGER